jgi:hypothetical protein
MLKRVPPQLSLSRRAALLSGGVGVVTTFAPPALRRSLGQEATPVAAPASAVESQDGLSADIIEVFRGLPGTTALQFWAPPDAGRPGWLATQNTGTQLCIASAFKAVVLTEFLRQSEDALDPTSSIPLADQLDISLSN